MDLDAPKLLFDYALFYGGIAVIATIALVMRERLIRRWWIVPAVFAAMIYPYALKRTQIMHYDFPVYYAAAHGQLVNGPTEGYYVYSPRLVPIFKPLALGTYAESFTAFYVISTIAYIELLRRVFRRYRRFPVTVCAVAILSGGAFFVLCRVQNIGGILALACVTPLGALLAMCVKPYLAPFVVVHAARACHAHRRQVAAVLPAMEDQLPVRAHDAGDC